LDAFAFWLRQTGRCFARCSLRFQMLSISIRTRLSARQFPFGTIALRWEFCRSPTATALTSSGYPDLRSRRSMRHNLSNWWTAISSTIFAVSPRDFGMNL